MNVHSGHHEGSPRALLTRIRVYARAPTAHACKNESEETKSARATKYEHRGGTQSTTHAARE
eukprot:10260313-Alexandrium_andersonii.AAC.1